MRKDKYGYFALITSIVCGLIAHGYMLTNKLCYHDDAASYFSFGADYTSGRWVIGLCRDLQFRLGMMQYSTPLWNGFIFILLLAFVSGIFVKMFQIENYLVAGIIGAVMICFPTVTSILHICSLLQHMALRFYWQFCAYIYLIEIGGVGLFLC